MITDAALFSDYEQIFALSPTARRRVVTLLRQWRDAVPRTNRTANLVGELYELLDELQIRTWDLNDPMVVNRLGTLARLSSLLADYESVRRRGAARPRCAR
jgi:DNA helicase-2/ATP-dependent DNA helicase PcrA